METQQATSAPSPPSVSVGDFAMLDSESPMFHRACRRGADAVSEVKSASDDEWEIAKAPEDDCSEMVADARLKGRRSPRRRLVSSRSQLADLFSTEYRAANDPTRGDGS